MTAIAKSRGAFAFAACGIGSIVAAETVREYTVRESSARKTIDTFNQVQPCLLHFSVCSLVLSLTKERNDLMASDPSLLTVAECPTSSKLPPFCTH